MAVLAVNVGAGLLLQRPAAAITSEAQPDRGPLTRRESEICLLLTDGLTNKEIASRLYITEASVDSHLAHVRQKLDFAAMARIMETGVAMYTTDMTWDGAENRQRYPWLPQTSLGEVVEDQRRRSSAT